MPNGWDQLPFRELTDTEILIECVCAPVHLVLKKAATSRLAQCPWYLNELERRSEDPFYEEDDVDSWIFKNWDECLDLVHNLESDRIHRFRLRGQRNF